jgi:hypothetical protein
MFSGSFSVVSSSQTSSLPFSPLSLSACVVHGQTASEGGDVSLPLKERAPPSAFWLRPPSPNRCQRWPGSLANKCSLRICSLLFISAKVGLKHSTAELFRGNKPLEAGLPLSNRVLRHFKPSNTMELVSGVMTRSIMS